MRPTLLSLNSSFFSSSSLFFLFFFFFNTDKENPVGVAEEPNARTNITLPKRGIPYTSDEPRGPRYEYEPPHRQYSRKLRSNYLEPGLGGSSCRKLAAGHYAISSPEQPESSAIERHPPRPCRQHRHRRRRRRRARSAVSTLDRGNAGSRATRSCSAAATLGSIPSEFPLGGSTLVQTAFQDELSLSEKRRIIVCVYVLIAREGEL